MQALRSGRRREAVASDLVYNAIYAAMERFDDGNYGEPEERAALESLPRARSQAESRRASILAGSNAGIGLIAPVRRRGSIGRTGSAGPSGLAGSQNPMSITPSFRSMSSTGSFSLYNSNSSAGPLSMRSSGIYASFDGSVGSPGSQKEDDRFGESALDEYVALSSLLERWLKGRFYEEPDAEGVVLTGSVTYTHPKLLPLFIHTLRYV